MPISQTIFAQLMSFIDHDEFNRCVERYDENQRVKEFSCYDQFICMIFSQLAKKRSLRDTLFTLQLMKSKLYLLGIRSKQLSRSNVAGPNKNNIFLEPKISLFLY